MTNTNFQEQQRLTPLAAPDSLDSLYPQVMLDKQIQALEQRLQSTKLLAPKYRNLTRTKLVHLKEFKQRKQQSLLNQGAAPIASELPSESPTFNSINQ